MECVCTGMTFLVLLSIVPVVMWHDSGAVAGLLMIGFEASVCALALKCIYGEKDERGRGHSMPAGMDNRVREGAQMGNRGEKDNRKATNEMERK